MKKRIKSLLIRIYKTVNMSEMVLLPGQLAFFLVLAIIPTVTLIAYGASILNLSLDFIFEFFSKAFSNDIANLILSTSSNINQGLELTIVLVICYYLSSNGSSAIIVTSNAIYGVKNSNWFRRRFKAIVMSIIFVLLIVFLLVVPILGNYIIGLIKSVNLNTDITNIIINLYQLLKSPLMWIILFLLIKIIYILAPDRQITGHNANYGAIFTTISWIVITKGYSYYINNVANYSSFYGGLASVCVLMVWFYFLAYTFVIGMSLNYQKETDDKILEKTMKLEETSKKVNEIIEEEEEDRKIENKRKAHKKNKS